MEKLGKARAWSRRWWKSVVAAVSAAAAFAGAFWGALAAGPLWQAVGFVIGVLGAVAAAFIPVADANSLHQRIDELERDVAQVEEEGREGIEAAHREGREELLLILDFALQPLLSRLGPLVRSQPRSNARATLSTKIRSTALSVLKEVIDPSIPMLRANYFKLRFESNDQPYLEAFGSTAVPPR